MTIPLPPSGVAELRRLWQEARADRDPGLDPDDVLGELEHKYQTMADATGDTQ
jgi:hypothetical protein